MEGGVQDAGVDAITVIGVVGTDVDASLVSAPDLNVLVEDRLASVAVDDLDVDGLGGRFMVVGVAHRSRPLVPS